MAAPNHREAAVESVVVWSGDAVIGPIYYPANADADSPSRLVAEDLGRILKIASGCEWSVLPEPSAEVAADGIFIGDTLRSRLDGVYGSWDARPTTGMSRRELLTSGSWDRTTVLAHPRRLVINGSTPEATRNGVYQLLQKTLGCRWILPGESGERIPHSTRFTLRVGWRDLKPDFLDRKFLLAGSLNKPNEQGLWAIRNGASSHFSFNHSLHRIFTKEVLRENPEWRAVRFGKRSSLRDVRGNGAQPDLLNGEVIDFATDYALGQREQDADLLTLSVATNDSIRYDGSETTMTYLQPLEYFRGKPNYSDLVFNFTNEVAAAVGSAAHPLFITQLAYMWTERPPKFSVAENVIPYICTDQSQWYDPRYRRDDKELIEAWGTAGPLMLGAWEYYQGQPYLIPRYFPSLEAESLKWLWENRTRGVFFSGHPVWEYDAPKYWLAGRLAWDVSQDYEQLLAEYFAITYGPAADAMKRFFAEAEIAWLTQPGEGMWLKYWNNPDQFALYPAERCMLMRQCLAEASQAAEEIEDARFRDQVLDLINQTESALAVTEAGAVLYHAWLKMPYPGQDVAPSTEEIAEFQDKRSDWLKVDKSSFTRHQDIIQIMDGLDPLSRWSSDWETVDLENFAEPIFEGDLMGAGPDSIGPDRFRRAWAVLASHAEGLSVKRKLEPAPHVRIEGADYFNLYRWLDIASGISGEFKLSVGVRGKVSPGAQVEINLYFMDTEGQVSESIYSDRLHPGEFDDWLVLARETQIPTDASRVCVGVRIAEQYPGDWLEIQYLDLQFRSQE